MRNTEGIGPLIIRNNVSALGPILTFNPSSGTGMVLQDIKIPIVFRNIYFKLNQTVHMIDIKRCTLIRFEGCKFETLVSGGRVLNIDEYSSVEIDKATMDNMATSNWWGLDNSGRTDAIKFIGYSAKPTVGLFSAGYRVIFVSPASGTYSGAICTDGGAPGVWKGFGLIE
jgi:hypothetical protein